MKRGEIYYADLDPARSGEANKLRPVVIVSNNSQQLAVLIPAPHRRLTEHVQQAKVVGPERRNRCGFNYTRHFT